MRPQKFPQVLKFTMRITWSQLVLCDSILSIVQDMYVTRLTSNGDGLTHTWMSTATTTPFLLSEVDVVTWVWLWVWSPSVHGLRGFGVIGWSWLSEGGVLLSTWIDKHTLNKALLYNLFHSTRILVSIYKPGCQGNRSPH